MKRILSILFIITFGVNIFASDIMTVSACSNEMTNYDEHDTKEENSNFDRGKSEESAAKNISISADVTQNSIILRWNPDLTVASYDIDVDGQLINVGAKCIYQHNKLSPNSKHTYRIRINYKDVSSEWSTYFQASTCDEDTTKTDAIDNNDNRDETPKVNAPIINQESEKAKEDSISQNKIIKSEEEKTKSNSSTYSKNISQQDNKLQYAEDNSSYSSDNASSKEVNCDKQNIEILQDLQGVVGTEDSNTQTDIKEIQSTEKVVSEENKNSTITSNETVAEDKNLDKDIQKDNSGNAQSNVIENTVVQNKNLQETNNSSTLSNQQENKNEEVKSDAINTQGVEEKISLNTPQNIIVKKTYNSINLKWDPVENASEYEVEIDGITKRTNTIEYTSEGLSPEQQHTYRVRAISGTSNSEWSEAITAVTDKVLDLTVSSSITLTEDAVYKDVTIKSGTINLNGHKLNVLKYNRFEWA